MRRRQLLLLGGGLAITTLAGCKPSSDDSGSGTAGAELLFAQQLPDLSGVVQPLSQWRGQPLVVNFWATWCAPCVREMPDLDGLQAEFPGVRFIGIGIDNPDNMREFVQKVPVSYTLLEARTSGLDLMQQLGNATGGLPFTLVVTADRQVARAIEGQVNPDDLRATLRQLTA